MILGNIAVCKILKGGHLELTTAWTLSLRNANPKDQIEDISDNQEAKCRSDLDDGSMFAWKVPLLLKLMCQIRPHPTRASLCGGLRTQHTPHFFSLSQRGPSIAIRSCRCPPRFYFYADICFCIQDFANFRSNHFHSLLWIYQLDASLAQW